MIKTYPIKGNLESNHQALMGVLNEAASTRPDVAACRSLEARAPAPVRKACSYYANNEQRMNYAHLREQGYLIGSGTVESACKQLALLRLCCAGARWSKDGLVHTAKARAAWLSDDWDTLAARRAKLPLAA